MRTWKRDQPGQYVTNGYTVIKFDRDGKWHVFDTNTKAEVTLHGLDTLRAAKALVEVKSDGASPAVERLSAKPARLTPKMVGALKETLQAEVGISRSDHDAARSGIIESYMIKVGTAVALIDRGMLTPVKVVEGAQWTHHLEQITAAGCKAIGRSMDEIVAWAWGQAMAEHETRSWFVNNATRMTALPVEVGAVVGWTHGGEQLTGEVRSIFGDALSIWVPSSSITGYEWTVTLDAIERVIELAPATHLDERAGINAEEAYDLAVIEYVVREDLGDDSKRATAKVVNGWALDSEKIAEGRARIALSYTPIPLHVYDAAFVEYFKRGGLARDHAATPDNLPPFPKGTPEYAAYETELKVELAKFAKGETPYEYPPATPSDDARLRADLVTGRMDRKALSIVPPAAPKGLRALIDEAITAAVRSERVNTLGSAHFGSVRERSDARSAATAALEAVQTRLDAYQILDGQA